MKLTLEIWRQAHAGARGVFVRYEVDELVANMSFLEALDVLNEQLIGRGEVPVAFDHDCREGICGSCGMTRSRACTTTTSARRSANAPDSPHRTKGSRFRSFGARNVCSDVTGTAARAQDGFAAVCASRCLETRPRRAQLIQRFGIDQTCVVHLRTIPRILYGAAVVQHLLGAEHHASGNFRRSSACGARHDEGNEIEDVHLGRAPSVG